MPVTLRKLDDACEGDKRQHVPYLVKWRCPKCGQEQEQDYANDRHLSYPQFPGRYELGFNCENCDHEERVAITTDIVITLEES